MKKQWSKLDIIGYHYFWREWRIPDYQVSEMLSMVMEFHNIACFVCNWINSNWRIHQGGKLVIPFFKFVCLLTFPSHVIVTNKLSSTHLSSMNELFHSNLTWLMFWTGKELFTGQIFFVSSGKIIPFQIFQLRISKDLFLAATLQHCKSFNFASMKTSNLSPLCFCPIIFLALMNPLGCNLASHKWHHPLLLNRLIVYKKACL